jgi:lysophospholipase L1-like esterase
VIRAVLVAAGLLAGLGLAEGVCRLLPAYRLERFAHRFGPGLDHHPSYQADARLGYAHVPVSLTGMNSVANRLGLVNPDFPLVKGPRTKRILVLGDSIVEYGVMTAELQRLLDARADGTRWEVWNAAVGGYNAAQYARLLDLKGDLYAPDFVLIGFCLNDFAYEIPVFFREPNGKTSVYTYLNQHEINGRLAHDVAPWQRRLLSPWLLRRSALYRLAVTVMHRRETEALPMNERYYRVGYDEVDRIQRWAARRGLPVAALVFPYLSAEEKLPFLMNYERTTMPVVLDALRLPWLDLAKILTGPDRSRWRLNTDDIIHPSTEANLLVARRAYEFIERLGWTSRPAPAARPGT